MRISIVSSFFLPVPAVAGGAMEKIWFRLAREFAAAGHEVTFISRAWPGFPERETIDGIRMIRVPGFDHTPRLWRNLLLDFIWGLRVARRLPPGDVVACNTVSLPVYLALIRPSAGRVVAVLGRMPKGHAKFYGRVDRLIATSEAVRARVILENPRLEGRTRAIPNPIDWELHRAHARKAAPPGPVTIGYVGRLHPEKGLEILLRAAADLGRRPELPPWRLRLIGPQGVAAGGGGEAYIADLRALGAKAGAEVSIEQPTYDPVALAEIYGGMDVFCYPSVAERGEGLSVAPIEAMAAAAVPVVSGLECYRDIVEDGRTGFVFDHRGSDPPVALAEILAKLIGDDALRQRMGTAAQERARFFDYADCARFLLADFEQLVSAPASG